MCFEDYMLVLRVPAQHKTARTLLNDHTPVRFKGGGGGRDAKTKEEACADRTRPRTKGGFQLEKLKVFA